MLCSPFDSLSPQIPYARSKSEYPFRTQKTRRKNKYGANSESGYCLRNFAVD
jgi:hypothetical protein